MTKVIEMTAIVAAALLLLPVLVLFFQVMAAVFLPSPATPAGSARPQIAVLVPAHNEASGIAATLTSIQSQLEAGDRLLVIADNCTDATAQLARSLGAEVLERQDGVRRGKGYALDFGIRHLEAAPPEVVVIIDADCTLNPGTLEAISALSLATGRPIQAMDFMYSPSGAGLKTRVAEFAWVVKNQVRPLGFYALGLPCQLMGSGMALPWPLIATAPLASGHLTEDLKLGLDLSCDGKPPLLCPNGQVSSYFPSSTEGLQTQRVRWEHGHLGIILGEAPRLLLKSFLHLDGRLLAMALDLLVPPLVLLTLLVLALTAMTGVFYVLVGAALPLALAAGAALLLALSVLAAWWHFGRRILSFGNLLAALGYALWKIPIYLKFLMGRQVEWIRSKRDES